MFATKTTILFFIIGMIVHSQGFSIPHRIISHRSSSRHTHLSMMWDTKKMGGAHAGTIERKQAPVEEEAIKGYSFF